MLRPYGMDEIRELSEIFENKGVNPGIYKKCIIGLLFYAFLSLKEENLMYEVFGDDNLSIEEAYVTDGKWVMLEKKSLKELGYYIKLEDDFKSIIKSIREDNFSLNLLNEKLDNIRNSFSWDYPRKSVNVFNWVDWSNPCDNLELKEQTELISEVLSYISENEYLDSNLSYFIHQLYNNLEKAHDDSFYINSFHINRLLYDLILYNRKNYDNVYDASCNLNRIDDFICPHVKGFGAGIELNSFTCTCDDNYNHNIVNMYPIMYEIEKEFHIMEKKDFNNNNSEYDLIIGTYNGLNDIPEIQYNQDEMQCYHDIDNMLLRLKKDGLMTIILPTDHIFNKTSHIINYMQDNVLDTIIKLPRFNNHEYSIIILKNNSNDTLLVDATYLPNFRIPEESSFEDDYNTFFYHPDIRKKFKYIRKTYKNRTEIDNFSHIITSQESNNLESMENYSIIHSRHEDDSSDPILNQLKRHRFPAPPWIMYPTIPLGSMGWRMGTGEHYMKRYKDYIDDKELYDKLFPKPITWNWIREGDNSISPQLMDYMRYSGGKYKFFTSDGKTKYNIDYKTEKDIIIIINDTILDFKDSSTFRFASKKYTLQSFIEEEKSRQWGVNGKPCWDEIKYTLCLNANYSKIVSSKRLVDNLLKTKDKILIYVDDSPWGVQENNGQKKGENLHALALMQVRDEIRKVYENYDIIDWDISKYI